MSASASASRGPVVHVVDDDDAVRTGFVRLLRSAGLEVHAYQPASSFFDQLEKVPAGCILFDISTGIASPKALQQLKEKRSSLPVVVVSARDNEAVHKLVREIGAKMFLRKPVDDQALLDAINWVTKRLADS